MTEAIFQLDLPLQQDSDLLGHFKLSQLRLMRDLRFDWLLLVPERAQCSEWFDLNPIDQQQLHQEVMFCAHLLKQTTHCEKVNIGALGNVVKQLHVHVLARNIADACWPKPVWGSVMQSPTPAQQENRCGFWRNAIGEQLSRVQIAQDAGSASAIVQWRIAGEDAA